MDATAAAKLHTRRSRSNPVSPSSSRFTRRTLPTFDVIAKDWLSNLKTRVKESTARYYGYIYAHYLAPYIGDKTPDFVTKDTAKEIVDSHEMLSDVSARNIVAVLRSLLRYSESVCGVSAPRQTLHLPVQAVMEEDRSLSDESRRALQTCLLTDESDVAASIALAFFMGLRTGEICALQKEDVDLSQGLLHIRHTIQRVGGGTGQTEVRIGAPKSEISNRTVPIPDRLLSKLKTVCAKREPGEFLFGKNGKLMEPRTLQYRFRRFLTKHGLPNISFQQLRKNFAIQNLKQNADIRTLGEIMGDGSVGLMAQRIETATMEKKREQMNRFAVAW